MLAAGIEPAKPEQAKKGADVPPPKWKTAAGRRTLPTA